MVALLASTLLLTASASPASAAPGRAYVANHGSDTVSVIDLAIPPGTSGGRYQVCSRAPVGSGSTITAPVTLDVA